MGWEELDVVQESSDELEQTARMRQIIENLAAALKKAIEECPEGSRAAMKIPPDNLRLLKEWNGEGGKGVLAAVCREVEEELDMPEGSITAKVAETVIAFFWPQS